MGRTAVTWLRRLAGGLVLVVAGTWVAFQVSPWPGALLIRRSFARGGQATAEGLEKHVPPGISAALNERYDSNSADAYLDVYYPSALASSQALPTIVWVHGGAWVAGSKDEIGNYARILASRGYTVVSVGYALAPGSNYPTPVRQVNAALAYLTANATRLHVDPARMILAGDSAGAQIVAQVTVAITSPGYAAALGIAPVAARPRGVVLHCGAYDTSTLNLEGPFGGFLRTVLWSYSGVKHFQDYAPFATASVIGFVTPDFPPVFISAGNADPLLPQSRAFAAALASAGVSVDTLFYPDDYAPPLGHEYQFNLDNAAGQLALSRALEFIERSSHAANRS